MRFHFHRAKWHGWSDCVLYVETCVFRFEEKEDSGVWECNAFHTGSAFRVVWGFAQHDKHIIMCLKIDTKGLWVTPQSICNAITLTCLFYIFLFSLFMLGTAATMQSPSVVFDFGSDVGGVSTLSSSLLHFFILHILLLLVWHLCENIIAKVMVGGRVGEEDDGVLFSSDFPYARFTTRNILQKISKHVHPTSKQINEQKKFMSMAGDALRTLFAIII